MSAFTGTAVSQFAERLQKHVDKSIRILHGKAGKPIECGQFLDALAFDV
jgi:hypothetical protein